MSRRITLRNEDHEWMVGIVEGMIRKANKDASIWVDHMPQLERVLDRLYTADPGFEELFPEELPAHPEVEKTAAPATPAAKKRGRPAATTTATKTRTEKKPRAKRGERLAMLPQLCKEHPAYGAVRPPRTDCSDCWAAYKRKHGERAYTKAVDRFNSKGAVA